MLEFQTFGAIDLRAEGGGRLDELLDQPKRLALLTYLAARQPSGPVRREKLVSLLWPDSAPTSGRRALSTTLSRLRETIGEDALLGRGAETISLSAEHVRSDVTAFVRALDEGRHREAVDLYAGPFLAGFRPPDARPFEEWVTRRRDEYAQQAYRAALEAAGEAREAGESATAEAYLREAAEIEPLREEAVRGLVEHLAGRGDRASALRVFESFRDRLDEEVGVSPSAELAALADDLRSGSAGGGEAARRTASTEAGPEGEEPGRESTPGPAVGEARYGPEEERPTFLTSRRFELLLIGVLLLAGSVGWLLYATGDSEGAGPTGNSGSETAATSVAVLPFQVSGAASETWRDGMVTLLSTGLDGAAGLRAVADRTVLAAWERIRSAEGGASSEEALSVARKVGARYAVLGSAVAVGGELRLSAAVHETASGDRLEQIQVRGSRDSVSALADRLARRVVGALAEQTGRGWSAADVASVTSRSLPALKAYLEGEVRYRSGDFEAAIEDFRRSVDEDTAFALAHWRLASSSSWANRGGVPRFLQRAYELRDRLPERERRILRASWLLRNREQALAAVDTARRLSNAYPDDPAVWYQLGDGVLHTGIPGGWREAETAFRNASRLAPGFAPYYIHHLQFAIAFHRDSTLAADRLADMPNRDGARPWFPLAMDLAFGNSERRRRALARIGETSDPARLPLGQLRESLLHPRDGELQEAVLRRYPADSAASEALVHNLLRRGRIDEAIGELGAAPESPAVACGLAQGMSLGYSVPDTVLRSYLSPSVLDGSSSLTRQLCVGIYLVERGRDDELEELLSHLRTASHRGDAPLRERARIRDVLDVLRGYSAWKGEDLNRAARLLGRSVHTDLPHFLASSWRGLWRGDVHRRLGRLEQAESWYMTAWFHAVAHERLGRLYEETGELEKAAAAYRRFVAAWEDADDPLQYRRKAARSRLEALRARATSSDDQSRK